MNKNDLKSFSAVATHEVKEEARVMALCVRELYDAPIFLYCDPETQEFLGDIKNIQFKPLATPEMLAILDDSLNVARPNKFHRPDCISLKMDCMQWAIRETGNTMFLDADVYLKKHIHKSIVSEVMLSPNYFKMSPAVNKHKFGVYNAGYVFACDQQFTEKWRDIYYTKSKFYEQEGMIYLLKDFDVEHFDKTHNVGFWRCKRHKVNWSPGGGMNEIMMECDINWGEVKSIHGHLYPHCYKNCDSEQKKIYDKWREVFTPQL